MIMDFQKALMTKSIFSWPQAQLNNLHFRFGDSFAHTLLCGQLCGSIPLVLQFVDTFFKILKNWLRLVIIDVQSLGYLTPKIANHALFACGIDMFKLLGSRNPSKAFHILVSKISRK